MLIIALNIRHGGGKRAVALSGWLLAEQPDVAVLSEWQDTSGGAKLVAALSAAGYALAMQPEAGKANGILVASKLAIAARRAVTPPDSTAGELMLISFAEFDAIGAYFPTDAAKRPFFACCSEIALTHRNRPLLLIGDLNTGDNHADLTPGGVPFNCADEFGTLADTGMIDLWRTQHGPHAREYTWSTTKNDFRVDHAFANAPFLDRLGPIDCYYDHQTRGARLTDHSALIVRGSLG